LRLATCKGTQYHLYGIRYHKSDVTKTVDPFAGPYAIESMTGDLEAAALTLIQAVDDVWGVYQPHECCDRSDKKGRCH
jgi:hypothetical protein